MSEFSTSQKPEFSFHEESAKTSGEAAEIKKEMNLGDLKAHLSSRIQPTAYFEVEEDVLKMSVDYLWLKTLIPLNNRIDDTLKDDTLFEEVEEGKGWTGAKLKTPIDDVNSVRIYRSKAN